MTYGQTELERVSNPISIDEYFFCQFSLTMKIFYYHQSLEFSCKTKRRCPCRVRSRDTRSRLRRPRRLPHSTSPSTDRSKTTCPRARSALTSMSRRLLRWRPEAAQPPLVLSNCYWDLHPPRYIKGVIFYCFVSIAMVVRWIF